MKPTFETSTDVERCISFLADKAHASYAEISKHLGRDIKRRDRHILTSARRILERDRGTVFVVERNIGVVRASNGQVAKLSTAHPVVRIKRITRKADKRQARVNVQALNAEDMLAFSVGRVVLDTISKTTRKSFYSQIAAELKKRDNELVTVNQVLALPRHRTKRGG